MTGLAFLSPVPLSVTRSRRHVNRCRGPVASLRGSPIKSPAAQKSEVFSNWLEENGMYLSPLATWGRPKHPIAIADKTTEDGEDSGRGLIAIKGIVQGEPIFEVPYEIIINKERACEKLPVEDADEYIAIAMLLISERAKGEDSFWKPYLDILPEDDELVPLFRWSEEDLALLNGSPCIPAALSLKDKLNKEYAMACDNYFSKDRDTFAEDVFTYEAWEWAFAILFSRAIMLQGEEKIALVPYADLLNHNPFVSTYIDVQRQTLSDEKYVCLFTDRPYSQMDQAFVTYGPKSNGELLLLYGFITDRNPYDSVELDVSVSESDPLYERKQKYMLESGVEGTASFPLYRDRYPMELIEFLRFCVSDEEEFEDSDFGGFINEKNETLVANALMDACKAALKNYPQSRKEDDKLINDRSMFQMFGVKQRWAIRHRRSEKRILERTIANIEAEISDPTFMFVESKE